MQDESAEGAAVFKCDFCLSPWSEDLAMVEGHRGSIICGRCLSVAYAELIHLKSDRMVQPGEKCLLCLEEERPEPHWESPTREGVLACKRCIKQSAGVLHKDRDIAWSKPSPPGGGEEMGT